MVRTMTASSSQPYRGGSGDECSLGVKFVSAGIGACIADVITYPLDMAKVRLQIQNSSSGTHVLNGARNVLVNGNYVHSNVLSRQSPGMVSTLREICRKGGPRAMYAGLPAGLQRQLCFSSIRIGLYDDVKTRYQRLLKHDTREQPKVYVRVLSGLTTGAVSVTLAQPTEVVKVRMQAAGAGTGPVYRGVFSAYLQIAVTEGLPGLWRGYIPNVIRNSITGVSELVTYDVAKEHILKRHWMSDSFPCHVVSGLIAGFVATVISSPIDVVKTRYMSSGAGEYNGVLQCASSLIKENGPRALYKGFIPAFMRFGSWNILTFVCFEQLKRLLSKNKDLYNTSTSSQRSTSNNKDNTSTTSSYTARSNISIMTSRNSIQDTCYYPSLWRDI